MHPSRKFGHRISSEVFILNIKRTFREGNQSAACLIGSRPSDFAASECVGRQKRLHQVRIAPQLLGKRRSKVVRPINPTRERSVLSPAVGLFPEVMLHFPSPRDSARRPNATEVVAPQRLARSPHVKQRVIARQGGEQRRGLFDEHCAAVLNLVQKIGPHVDSQHRVLGPPASARHAHDIVADRRLHAFCRAFDVDGPAFPRKSVKNTAINKLLERPTLLPPAGVFQLRQPSLRRFGFSLYPRYGSNVRKKLCNDGREPLKSSSKVGIG